MTHTNRLTKAADFLSVKEAAGILRLSERHLRRLIAQGRSPIRCKRISERIVVIPRSALEELAQVQVPSEGV